jgi:hypothetical protein
MLRYLRRIDDITSGTLRWGILTNGAKWRLYFSGARSVSEQFFELDIAAILDLPGHNDGLFALNEDDRRHWLTVFYLIFRRDAFVPSSSKKVVSMRNAWPRTCRTRYSARSFPISSAPSSTPPPRPTCKRCARRR